MSNLSDSLVEARREVDDMIRTAAACAGCWSTPRAPGKWSPSQVVEHVARSFESSASDVFGVRSEFPDMPRIVRPVLRSVLFRRVLRTGTFPKARTNRAMNPDHGPESPRAAAERLESAWNRFANACAERSSTESMASSRIFGDVPLTDYVRFQGLHTRHHHGQLRKSAATA